MKDKWLWSVFIVVFSAWIYVNVEYPEACAASLQSMREQDNPEYYILQELRKDKE